MKDDQRRRDRSNEDRYLNYAVSCRQLKIGKWMLPRKWKWRKKKEKVEKGRTEEGEGEKGSGETKRRRER